MEAFEEVLWKSTAKGENIIAGAIVAVVDKKGNLVYKNVAGYNGVEEDAAPLEFDQTLAIASCTKLITAIAALQVVEKGFVTLDEPLDKHIPELASQPIITAKENNTFELKSATKAITLRHLLTHSSGAVYDVFDPAIMSWRASRGETSNFPAPNQVVEEESLMPRSFEAGEGWSYGTGLDWTGLLISRLTNTNFETHVQEHIAKPLGITSFTFHLFSKPEVEKKLVKMSNRNEDGTLGIGRTPYFPSTNVGEAAGHGLYANVPDYTRVLADLLKDEPVLLAKESVDQLFTPQFEQGSLPQRALQANWQFSWGPPLGRSNEGVVPNFGLGGFINENHVKRENFEKPAKTLTWSGLPNLLWSVNREKGLALMVAQQTSPWADEKAWVFNNEFETAVWRGLAK
ncbi:beta-lactamase/transpeptidase-like protein [Aaosphaeria arxii CBS 175.79]|uniref:Beta-lactamase/transpeptidase-like protein n=1 Tax=Aaosphaeria arxii CBS 175.79 TaxID=1450172 RepID=A0A6A5XJ35_9PLEO|nr:beta-lactamase/transpeptidase-like protein [Aaosphaeria arxii CBS 175.79]KAF2012963.1 beta-lactamase/transpeptidase-like protein [Aaosphaeria arxii CBS 175.79]